MVAVQAATATSSGAPASMVRRASSPSALTSGGTHHRPLNRRGGLTALRALTTTTTTTRECARRPGHGWCGCVCASAPARPGPPRAGRLTARFDAEGLSDPPTPSFTALRRTPWPAVRAPPRLHPVPCTAEWCGPAAKRACYSGVVTCGRGGLPRQVSSPHEPREKWSLAAPRGGVWPACPRARWALNRGHVGPLREGTSGGRAWRGKRGGAGAWGGFCSC